MAGKKLGILAIAGFMFNGCLPYAMPRISQPAEHYAFFQEDKSESLKSPFENFKSEKCKMMGKGGQVVLMKNFFAESMKEPESIKYAEDMLAKIEASAPTALSGLELAVFAVDELRKDISTTHGKGMYTLKHEATIRKEIIRTYSDYEGFSVNFGMDFTIISDSTQTLGEFVSHESGKYEGDCDDFARSLLTAYELVKRISKEKAGETGAEGSKFHEKLYNGLRHYRVVGLDLPTHAMNAIITYGHDFSTASIRLIEPQTYDFLGDYTEISGLKIIKEDINNLAYAVMEYKPRKNVSGSVWRRIQCIYTLEECYGQPSD